MAAIPEGTLPGRRGLAPGALVQLAGAGLSLALVAGIGVWGYQLMLRDATGVPVVRAMSGPMREAPASPGGEVAPHMGLSVNEVAAVGSAVAESDALVLAPQPLSLAEEDLAHVMTAEADELRGDFMDEEEETPLIAAALREEDGAPLDAEGVIALADAIAEMAEEDGGTFAPVETPQVTAAAFEALEDEDITAGIEEDAAAPAEEAPAETDVATARIDTSIPGVAQAPRPPARPSSLVMTDSSSEPAADAPSDNLTVAEAPLPAGTVLVQLGAFASAELANDAWAMIQGDFGELIGDREPVVQTAQAGGSTFYRLRMKGFEALGDARRFCSALAAEDAGCIPYLVE
ncbi:SPOR domain-containing protein [Pseudoroseicyclus sp. H15]